MGFIKEDEHGSYYSAHGYHVLVGPDGAIKVQPGDSLSKYSMAIYGDFENMDKKFGRNLSGKVRSFQEMGADINRIMAGETIYQMSRYNTHRGEKVPADNIQLPGIPPIPTSEYSRRISAALRYIQQAAWIGSDWELTGSDGMAIGIGSPGIKFGGSLSAMRFWVKRSQDPAPLSMVGGSIGGSLGANPDPIPIDLSFSHHTFPSKGLVLKGPSAGATLARSELGGPVVTFELSGHGIAGGSIVLVVGGPNVNDFFTNPVVLAARLFMPKWLIVNAGLNLKIDLELSATVSLGYLYAY